MEELETLKKQAYDAAKEILEIGKCKAGDLFVVGCSTSEVLGDKIGTASSPETAQAVFAGIYQAVQEKQVYLAAQCCEHLNRALIIEEEAARKFGYEEVNVVPQPKPEVLSLQPLTMHLYIQQQWSTSKPVPVWTSVIP